MTATEKSSPISALPRWKKFAFLLFPATTLCVVLLLVEAAFRVFAPAGASRFVDRTSYDGQEWLRINRACLEKYFPATSPLIPEFKPTLLAPERKPGGLRILCLGESSMFGTPYEMNATIPAILRKQLRHQYPGREIEVVNLGASAINTNVILDLAPAMLTLHPDLVLIYTGHNEFYGPDGIGAPWIEKRLPWLIPLNYALHDLRSVQWLQREIRSSWLSHNAGIDRNMMRQVSEGSHVVSGSEEEERIVATFRRNLAAIITTFRSDAIPVIVSDISSNLLFPPFAAELFPGIERMDALIARGRAIEALQGMETLHAHDSSNAFVEYRLGICSLATGDSIAALHFLRRARDLDLLKFRAPGAINDAIHNVCSHLDVPCVSADSLLCSASPHGITGQDLFWEHLHPNAEGYYRIAGLFLEAMHRNGLLPPNPATMSHLPCDMDSLSIPWLDLAYADLSIRGLTSRWPFEHYAAPMKVLDRADTTLRAIVLSVYRKTTGWNEGCMQTAAFFVKRRDNRDAITTYEAILENSPRAFLTRYLLAVLLRDEGRIGAAMEQYAGCIATNPSYPFARVDLGLLLINAGQLDSAEIQLTSALDLGQRQSAPPTLLASAHYGLAAIAANKGDLAGAMREVDAALLASPSYGAARQLREQLSHTRHPG